MHPLRNGSQATERPAAKPLTGTPGWFTESGDNNIPSYPGADWFNHVIAEFQNALAEMGVTFDPTKDNHLALAFNYLLESIQGIESNINDLNAYDIKNSFKKYVGFPSDDRVLGDIANYKPIQTFNYDKAFGSTFALLFDQIKKDVVFSSIKLGSCGVNDGTTSATISRALDLTFTNGCVSGFASGNFNYSIYVKQTENYIQNNVIVPDGQVHTPFMDINPANASYVKVKKGTGQGKMLISFQYQTPLDSLEREVADVELIDLDDGQPVRYVDVLMPEISDSTMNSILSIKEGKGLRYVIKAIEGALDFDGYGFKLGSNQLFELQTGEINSSNLPSNGYFCLPSFVCPKCDAVYLNISQKTAGTSGSVSDVKFNFAG